MEVADPSYSLRIIMALCKDERKRFISSDCYTKIGFDMSHSYQHYLFSVILIVIDEMIMFRPNKYLSDLASDVRFQMKNDKVNRNTE